MRQIDGQGWHVGGGADSPCNACMLKALITDDSLLMVLWQVVRSRLWHTSLSTPTAAETPPPPPHPHPPPPQTLTLLMMACE